MQIYVTISKRQNIIITFFKKNIIDYGQRIEN